MENDIRKYIISVGERVSEKKYKTCWNAHREGHLPVGHEYHSWMDYSPANIAQSIVKNFKEEKNWREKTLHLTAKEGSCYEISEEYNGLLRPPTTEEIKQLGEEVLKALKGG